MSDEITRRDVVAGVAASLAPLPPEQEMLDTDEMRHKRFMARIRRDGPPHQWGKRDEEERQAIAVERC